MLIAAVTFTAVAQNTWEPFKIDKNITVSFPGKPIIEQRGPVTDNIFRTADSTITLKVAVVDLSQVGLDSAQIAEGVQEEEFWETFVKQQIFQSFKDAIDETDEKITVLGLTGRKYEFESKGKGNEANMKVSLTTFFIGTNFYIFTFNNRKGTADLKNKELFFNSIQLTK